MENPILLQSRLRHLSDDLGMTLSRMKRAALGPKKTSSSQETSTFEGESREFLIRTERTLRFAVREIKAVLIRTCSHSPA